MAHFTSGQRRHWSDCIYPKTCIDVTETFLKGIEIYAINSKAVLPRSNGFYILNTFIDQWYFLLNSIWTQDSQCIHYTYRVLLWAIAERFTEVRNARETIFSHAYLKNGFRMNSSTFDTTVCTYWRKYQYNHEHTNIIQTRSRKLKYLFRSVFLKVQ